MTVNSNPSPALTRARAIRHVVSELFEYIEVYATEKKKLTLLRGVVVLEYAAATGYGNKVEIENAKEDLRLFFQETVSAAHYYGAKTAFSSLAAYAGGVL